MLSLSLSLSLSFSLSRSLSLSYSFRKSTRINGRSFYRITIVPLSAFENDSAPISGNENGDEL